METVEDIIEQYKTFSDSRHVRRTKAVRWAVHHIIEAKDALDLEIDDAAALLRRIGWTTFIGLGLYCGILYRIGRDGASIRSEFEYLYEIVTDIVRKTDIAYELSLDVTIVKSDHMMFARQDANGHTLIYPKDADELFDYIDSKQIDE